MSNIAPKVIAAARRRPGMTHAEYVSYVRDVHGGLTRADPVGLARYVQNHVYDGAFGRTGDQGYSAVFHRDSVTELYFANFDDLSRTFSSEYVQTVIAPDGANFADLATTQTIIAHEVVILTPREGEDLTKVMFFLFSADGSPVPDPAWADLIDAAIAPLAARGVLQGAIRSHALPATGGGTDKHFGSAELSTPALVLSLWLPDAALPQFREVEGVLLESGLFDQAKSYFLYTHAVDILEAPTT